MYCLGISGAFGLAEKPFLPNVPSWFNHDASAALFKYGKLVCACEEERFNRIKHTTGFPLNSIRYCLEQENISLKEINSIGYYFGEQFIDNELNLQYIAYPSIPIVSGKKLLHGLFRKYFSVELADHQLRFLSHHRCHAYSAYYDSGFDSSLVLVIDGRGESESTSVYSANNRKLEILHTYHYDISLGSFYLNSIQMLGYEMFDEYKVMGLAPYGDPDIYRDLFSKLYTLEVNGEYTLNIPLSKLHSYFLKHDIQPRRKGEKFDNVHKNFAAALQEALEIIALHIIKYWKEKTGHRNVCMAGGVAHNCTLNGKIARLELFDKMFVHPASSDSGAAVGAGMIVSEQEGEDVKRSQSLRNVYWGPHFQSKNGNLKQSLDKWEDFISISHTSDVEYETAKMIAEGLVIGWVQGEVEFGPRALGNRSIIADPRPSLNKSRINAMIKKREGYRPFAPSILEDEVVNYFELPKCEIDLSFMTYNLKVRKEFREQLGAITHVNGTGRVQTVAKEQNPRYWKLIYNFQKLTRIPLILNTSFNNNCEPIVNTIDESITCFLTTGLDRLVIGDYIIEKKPQTIDRLSMMSLSMPEHIMLVQEQDPSGGRMIQYRLRSKLKKSDGTIITETMYNYLSNCLINCQKKQLEEKEFPFNEEIMDLWSKRLILLEPVKDYSLV